jgi:hypothetical protein
MTSIHKKHFLCKRVLDIRNFTAGTSRYAEDRSAQAVRKLFKSNDSRARKICADCLPSPGADAASSAHAWPFQALAALRPAALPAAGAAGISNARFAAARIQPSAAAQHPLKGA